MQRLLKSTGAYRLLKTEGERTGFSHAYLLVFEDGKNLRLALKAFAKLLFGCEEGTPQKERISSLIDAESFCDCAIYPAEGKKLVVEDAESILEESTLAPVEGARKVFLIGDFAEANQQTQNKLLKLLEEPPKDVIFLLGTTSVFPVLPTVLSRTKRLEIFPFSTEETVGALKRICADEYDGQTLTLCAITSGGNVGDALALLKGGYYQTVLDYAFELALGGRERLPETVKKIGETPYKKELISSLRLLYRDALLIKLKTGTPLLLTERERLQKVAGRYALNALAFAQEALSAAEKQVKFNAVFAQCVEIAMANIFSRETER